MELLAEAFTWMSPGLALYGVNRTRSFSVEDRREKGRLRLGWFLNAPNSQPAHFGLQPGARETELRCGSVVAR